MKELHQLFENNRKWALGIKTETPDFFEKLSHQQSPQYFWIGCSDSRVPANEIIGLLPGEVFVHRNVANVVVHSDLNCLSCLQYAVDYLKVRHVIVSGHYGCGGVQAALTGRKMGLIDNWLRHVQDVSHQHTAALERTADDKSRADRLCELNVIEQVLNVSRTTVIQDAWARSQEVILHGWIYSLEDGLIRDLGMCCRNEPEVRENYRKAVALRSI